MNKDGRHSRWAFWLQVTSLLLVPALGRAQEVNQFWQETRARLAAQPMNAVVEPVEEALPYRKFRVTLTGLDGVRFCGFLALPIAGETKGSPSWPAIVSAPGYGGFQQGVMLSECLRGYAVLQIFPRAQGDSAALWKIDGPDKLTWRVASPEGSYYQGAYADVIRGIDYLVSRDDVQRDRIATVGTSQGGGIALAVAAIDARVKVVVAHLPFLCDMRLASTVPNALVKRLLDGAKCNNEGTLRTLDFFDPLQLAAAIRVPVLLSSGGKDEVCPAETIRAVYDRLPGIKSLIHYPELGHNSSAGFYEMSWPWLDLYLRK